MRTKNYIQHSVLLIAVAYAIISGCDGHVRSNHSNDYEIEDVSLIASWIIGQGDPGPFRMPFGDQHWFEESKGEDVLLYTDVKGAQAPGPLRLVPYDIIQSRIEAIKNGADRAPAIVITRTDAGMDGNELLGPIQDQDYKPNGRIYYIEVVIGNMATHWLKVELWNDDGKIMVSFLGHAVS